MVIDRKIHRIGCLKAKDAQKSLSDKLFRAPFTSIVE